MIIQHIGYNDNFFKTKVKFIIYRILLEYIIERYVQIFDIIKFFYIKI